MDDKTLMTEMEGNLPMGVFVSYIRDNRVFDWHVFDTPAPLTAEGIMDLHAQVEKRHKTSCSLLFFAPIDRSDSDDM